MGLTQNTFFTKIAYGISVIFHPLLIVTYILLIQLAINPYLFGKNSIQANHLLIVQMFIFSFVLPAFMVLMMKAIGLIDSLNMEDKQERVIPYIGTGIFYLWMYLSLHKNQHIPVAFTAAVLGSVLSLALIFFINIFTKISAHAAGVGGMVGMVLIMIRWFSYPTFTILWGGNSHQISVITILILVLIIAGLAGTARLILNAHTPKDLYAGFIVGFVTQFLAIAFLF